jgi:D-serine deaminase-like pyridoxal phosphate-dependent protein
MLVAHAHGLVNNLDPMKLTDLRTPFVFLDLPRVHANIRAMAETAAFAGVALRPHAKTHKSPEIARWQLDAGAVGMCVAKLGEAEVFADAGIPDIRLPYPVNPINADRVIALLDRTRLSIIVDDDEVARGWSEAMTRAGKTLEVLVKVDVGFHRCGINPSAVNAADRVAMIASLPGLKFRGLLSHAGNAYHAASEEELHYIVDREAEMMLDLAARAQALGVKVEEISVGSTPTARFIARQRRPELQFGPNQITEMRPGNYVFRDRTQVALGSATLENCAMFVQATVVSRPAPDRVILDSGAKTLALDGARGFAPAPGHGLVIHEDGTPDPSLVIERLSEEHATVKAMAPTRLKVGDRVRVLPNHACVVTNLMEDLVLEERGHVTGRLRVAARGRIS